MSKEYNEYLVEHRINVGKAFYWIQNNLPGLLKGDIELERQITADHDLSKSSVEEYQAYDDYFYGKNVSSAVKDAFNKAWLMHIHSNPHHWQYWMLFNDDPEEGDILIDIPYNYILEMICDWWSFSFKKGNLYEIFDWYNERVDKIKISPKTKTQVKYILGEIHKKLEELNV